LDKHIKSYIFLCSVFLNLCLNAHEVFIIVPGTWSLKESWFKLGGDFFEELKKNAKKRNAHVIWFRWLTQNTEQCRKVSAQELAHFLTSFDHNTIIHLVTHSHGTNVALGACNILDQHKKIKTLISLGAPIYEETYPPNMDSIEKILNFYSLNDEVQTLWAWKRIFQDQPGIHNIQLFLNNHEPTHAEMHHCLIARWITYITNLTIPKEAEIHLFSNKKPFVKNNLHQKERIENDIPLNLNSLMDWRNKRSA
jgi:hypothetical protein